MDIADKIRKARVDRKLSLEKLGDLLGVTRQAVWQWENEGKTPKNENISGLCEHLGMSLDDFYEIHGIDPIEAKVRRLSPAQRAMLEPMIDGLLAAQDPPPKRAVK